MTSSFRFVIGLVRSLLLLLVLSRLAARPALRRSDENPGVARAGQGDFILAARVIDSFHITSLRVGKPGFNGRLLLSLTGQWGIQRSSARSFPIRPSPLLEG